MERGTGGLVTDLLKRRRFSHQNKSDLISKIDALLERQNWTQRKQADYMMPSVEFQAEQSEGRTGVLIDNWLGRRWKTRGTGLQKS